MFLSVKGSCKSSQQWRYNNTVLSQEQMTCLWARLIPAGLALCGALLPSPGGKLTSGHRDWESCLLLWCWCWCSQALGGRWAEERPGFKPFWHSGYPCCHWVSSPVCCTMVLPVLTQILPWGMFLQCPPGATYTRASPSVRWKKTCIKLFSWRTPFC